MQGNRERPSKPSGGTTTRLAVAFALALVVAVQPAAAATITISTERQGDTIDIRASVVLNADAATAWRVLTDYDHYTEFIPDLRVSRVVARRGATVTVAQSWEAALWRFKIPLDVTFEINQIPPNSLQSRAVAGSLRALASSYALTPVASGVRLDYAGRVAPGFELFGHIEQMAVEQNVGASSRRSPTKSNVEAPRSGDIPLPRRNELCQAWDDTISAATSRADVQRPHGL